VKGSRGVALEVLVEALVADRTAASDPDGRPTP
jgi:hypothetical protein